MCLVFYFIMVMYLYAIGHQFLSIFFAWVTVKLMCPATKTEVPNNKDCYTLKVLTKASRYGLGSTQSPSMQWQFCGVSGWAQRKGAGKSKWQVNCLYLDSLYRCNGLELSLRQTDMLCSYAALSCCHGKCLLGMLILPQGDSVYNLKG